MCALLYATATPESAHAGLLSSVSSFINQITNNAQKAGETANTQTVDLLSPSRSQSTSSSDSGTHSSDGVISVGSGPLRISTEDEIYIPDDDTISVYVAKKTDTLASVAKLYGVTPNTIVWANDLKDRKITEGQILTILPVSGIRHIIKKGDTLKNITAKYSADIDDVAVFNGITSETVLVVGDALIIPDGEVTETAPKTKDTKKDAKDKKDKNTKDKKSIKTIIAGLLKQDGYFVRPIRGGLRTTGLHGHNAVDLASSVGAPIMAAASGRVIIVKTGGYNGGYGNYIVVAHPNGTQTLYAHNSENDVSVGDNVEQGQVVARVGSTGKSTGPHVHFEVRGARNPF